MNMPPEPPGPLRPPVSRDVLRSLVEAQPRINLATWPTPLEPLPNLTRHLGGPRIFIKREDLTGLGLGGNKTRILEFRLAHAVSRGCDSVVAALDVQSNSARQLAAAANRLGMPVHLVLEGSSTSPVQGNLLADVVLGANLYFVPEGSAQAVEAAVNQVSRDLRSEGLNPYVMTSDPSFELASALASVLLTLECRDQVEAMGGRVGSVYVSSRGKGQSGFVLADLALQDGVKTVGIASGPETAAGERAARVANRAAQALGLGVTCRPDDVVNHQEYVGPGYGVPSDAGLEAILLLARTEGVILDPVYTGKAMAGLADHVRRGLVPSDSCVVFVHTGGTPALFRHSETIARHAGSQSE